MTDPIEISAPHAALKSSRTLAVSERQAKSALARLKTDRSGIPYVVRFPLLIRVLHAFLLLSVTVLAFTGLAQVLHGNFLGAAMLRLLGGLDSAQGVHHTFAILLGIVALFHLLDVFESFFVRRQVPAMAIRLKDLADAFQTLKVDLGISKKIPAHDRFTVEQKVVYFVVALGVLVQGVTGLMRLFPIRVTEFLPGIVVTYAGILHRWDAILIILVVFIWHLYQVHVRDHNLSIFTSRMTIPEMQSVHPLELEYLQKAAASVGSSTWPVKIEMNTTEHAEAQVKTTKPTLPDEPAPASTQDPQE